MKTGVLIILDTLDLGGAENLAANIAIYLKKTKRYNPIVCLTRRGGALELKLSEYGIKYYILGRSHRHELYKFYGLRKIIADENIKLIHAHKPGSSCWAGIFGKLFGLPVISHFHTHPRQFGERGGYILSKIIGATSTYIICISELLRNELINENIAKPEKILAVHNGIDVKSYIRDTNVNIKKEFDIGSEESVVGIVAALRKEKNHELFLNTAAQILSTSPEFKFIIVGDGVRRDNLEYMARDLGIMNSCIFTGFRNDIADILSILDVCVLCSDWEGMPLVVLEYMAASKPVVSTNIEGVREIIDNEVNGLLVPPGDYGLLAKAIERVTGNKRLARKLGSNGYRTVSENFSEESMMKKIESVYEKALSENI